ncbi:hypothetical protein TrVGV298_007534 [Trichoderma virens]|nr:hypothetical protein TrVGV298_007534 [Trichoderma virens]
MAQAQAQAQACASQDSYEQDCTGAAISAREIGKPLHGTAPWIVQCCIQSVPAYEYTKRGDATPTHQHSKGMARGKKRKLGSDDASGNQALASSKHDTPVKKDLLLLHYPVVCTLREHVLSSLPDTSKIRRKKIAALGSSIDASAIEIQLAHVLDSTLVGTSLPTPKSESEEATWQQWLSFSQKGDESYVTISNGVASSIAIQSEIIDFVIWSLFSKERNGSWPKHILCDGFRRNARDDQSARSTIHGVFSLYPNFHVRALREAPWPHLLALLGQAGERVMINLLYKCSIFLKVDAGRDNYLQLTGIPLSELDTKASDHTLKSQMRKPSDITIVRSRIFYAKPATTAKGLVQAGFKHIHALNRHPHTSEVFGTGTDSQESIKIRQQNEAHTTKLMMYIFPRQFGLHNVFTSAIDANQTAQKFHDYTLREDEINKAMRASKGVPEKSLPKLPKRLRGTTRDLVRRLQILHARCSYFELLRHYCPTFLDGPHGSKKKPGDVEPSATSIQVPGRATQAAESQPKRRMRRHPTDASALP